MKVHVTCLLSVFLLSSCANGIGGFRPLTYREPAETRVFVSEHNCPSLQGQQLAPILATIAMGAASKLLEGFGTAISNASAGGQLPSSIATANFEIARGRTPKCLIIIRGAFAPTERGARAITLPATAFFTQTPEGNRFVDATVPLPPVYELHHYIEIQVLGSTDTSALSFAPVYAQFVRSMDGGSTGQREVSIAVKFDRPGRPQTGSALLMGPRQLRAEAHRFEPVEQTGRYPYEAAWFSSFHASTGQAESGPTSSLPVPVTVTTTVVETRPTRAFLGFVASVFSSVRPSFEGALKSEIDPATRDTELRSAYEAQGNYWTHLAAAHNAVAAYCALGSASSTSDRYTKSAAARSAQLTANRSAISADIDQPFAASALIAVSGGSVASANDGRCD